MYSFLEFLQERKNNAMIRNTGKRILYRINALSKEIEQEQDIVRQNRLISLQNLLQSRLSGLLVGSEISDNAINRRIKKTRK